MAQYSIVVDLVGLSKVTEQLDMKRRCEDGAARVAILKKASELERDAPGTGRKMLGAIKVLENHGLSTVESLQAFTGILDVFEAVNGGDEND